MRLWSAILVLGLITGLIGWISVSHLRPEGGDTLSLKPVNFTALPGWSQDNLRPALTAFNKSCAAVLALPPDRRLPGSVIGGTASDWYGVCRKALDITSGDPRPDNERIRAFFEADFTPLALSLNGKDQGLFTGYFEALLAGSFEKSARYFYPLYARPNDLINVDLGAFRPDLKGTRIAGKIQHNRLIPYEDREAIDAGALRSRADVLLWVDDPVDAFFLHIQGSGRVRLPDGRFQAVGYAGQNGHIYRAIGRDLIASGAVASEDMSMQAIRSWLAQNPVEAEALLHKNRSYIFFRLLEGNDGPFGSAGVALTPERSLAVDLRHLPLHAPMWLSTSHPSAASADAPGDDQPLNRLMIAQDTGGAIRGEIRGDVFWGFGERAASIAGQMANEGRYWLLLPKDLAATLTDSQ